MPCDRMLKTKRDGTRQTIKERADEIRAVVAKLSEGLASGRYRAVIDRRTGAVAFAGLSEADRDGVTDACAYRRIMATGSALARQAIARAEQLAGRSVSLPALAAGVHSHDGGLTFHHGH